VICADIEVFFQAVPQTCTPLAPVYTPPVLVPGECLLVSHSSSALRIYISIEIIKR
jgi:hypothetical protein